jgi:hypothetical protein
MFVGRDVGEVLHAATIATTAAAIPADADRSVTRREGR